MTDRRRIVDSICAATDEVFSRMLGLHVEPGEAYTEHRPEATDGVLALVGLAGRWTGTGMLMCTATFARKMASHLITGEGEPVAAVDDEVLDAVAEITNMIIGNMKNLMEGLMGPMGLSIPTVIFGRNFTTRSMSSREWTVVPFFSDGERVEIKVCLAPNDKPHPVQHGFPAPHAIQL